MPENTVEINPEYAARVAVAMAETDKLRLSLADTDPLPIMRQPTGPEVAQPTDWAEGTVDQRVRPVRPRWSTRESTDACTPTAKFLAPVSETATTTRRRAVSAAPWIAPDEEQTTGLVLLAMPDAADAPLVLPDDEIVFDFDEALAYLEVGDETTVCHDGSESGPDLYVVWDEDE